MKFTLYTDGGARGNPGPAATGIVIKDASNNTIAAYGEYLGHQTNNYAEYMAIISALKKAKNLGATEIYCYCDSKLVVEQLNRNWKVKEPSIQTLFLQAWKELNQFDRWTITHIRRELNKEADAEVNRVLDTQ
jgi:ribonuclease HI